MAIRDSSKAEIRKLLTPDQQEKFDVTIAKMKARFEKHRATFSDKDKSLF